MDRLYYQLFGKAIAVELWNAKPTNAARAITAKENPFAAFLPFASFAFKFFRAPIILRIRITND